MGNKLSLRIHILAIITLTLFSCLLAYRTWTNGLRETQNRAKGLAQAVAAGLSGDHVGMLSAESADIEKAEYQEIKHTLIQFAGVNTSARFASILMKKRTTAFYIRRGPANRPLKNYSPPGQKYEEATEVDFSFLYKPAKRSLRPYLRIDWGTWISVLVPIADNAPNIIGVLSVD